MATHLGRRDFIAALGGAATFLFVIERMLIGAPPEVVLVPPDAARH